MEARVTQELLVLFQLQLHIFILSSEQYSDHNYQLSPPSKLLSIFLCFIYSFAIRAARERM